MDGFLSLVIIGIIVVQIIFFILNIRRMHEFKNIFSEAQTWDTSVDDSTNFVSGIRGGDKSSIFTGIKLSINKYLYNNKGSVIDFNLLKDAVDRHCDSVEDDINAQTPVPLYFGLAGTMFGVIWGLVPLIKSGALFYLLNGGIPEAYQQLIAQGELTEEIAKAELDVLAASGINDLLGGVAWAMSASICGIILTTLNSVLFKSFKLKAESGKNSFLAWMQSELLPLLPQDTSDALTSLVTNLNAFNSTFEKNAKDLDSTLKRVNEVYQSQDKIIQAVKEMDVMKMAKANVNVLKELQECTDKLEQFNLYLSSVNGYTQTIQQFNSQFNQESQRLHVLEEIRDFFSRHKGELTKDTADADDALREAIKTLKDSSVTNVAEFSKHLTDQTDAFNEVVEAQKKSFVDFCGDMKITYSEQLGQLPQIVSNMSVINEVPEKLQSLIAKIEDSTKRIEKNSSDLNDAVKREVSSALSKLPKQKTLDSTSIGLNSGIMPVSQPEHSIFPEWMKWTIFVSIVVIAITLVIGVSFYVFKGQKDAPSVSYGNEWITPSNIDTNLSDTVALDTIR